MFGSPPARRRGDRYETKCRFSSQEGWTAPITCIIVHINRDNPEQVRVPPMAGKKPGEDRVLAGGAKYIDFQTDPSRYRHWKLDVAGDVATLTMDVDENGGLFGSFQLKLNSYDLGVDIELADAVQR